MTAPENSLALTAARRTDYRTPRLTAIACRTLDIVGAAVLLVLTMPLMLVIAAAVRLDSPGPAVFRQARLGRGLRPFTLNKFRTMHAGAGSEHHRAYVTALISGERLDQGTAGRPFFKIAADRRVTRAGRFLRKSSLDELPQLWNVLRGEMSLVGPRPPLDYEVEQYPPRWFDRFAVKPGITGLWQVSGRSRLTPDEMIELDLEYVRRRSLWFNVRILLRTIPAVINGRGAA